MNEPYLLADKPSGVPAYSSDPGREGFIEYLARKRREPLYLCSRLEREASGAVVFARSPEAAREFKELSLRGDVQKKYLLISEKHPDLPEQIEARSEILRRDSGWVSLPAEAGRAHTIFRRVRRQDRFCLWEAEPRSASPQQVRLHAAALGIPILGDSEHGGGAAPRLMLHLQSIAFKSAAGAVQHSSNAPVFFEHFEHLSEPQLLTWLAALDRRRRLFSFAPGEALRILHHDGLDVRCDRYGEVCWYYWYRNDQPSKQDLAQIAELTKQAGAKHWAVQNMRLRTQEMSNRHVVSSGPLPPWEISEHGLRYVMKADQGLSCGLFLDQRENRRWLMAEARGKRVLNLFAYTCGFGLAAAAAKAAEVVNVDSNSRILEWAKEDFALNHLLEQKGVEFWGSDARYFLERCRKRGRVFDLVICDPPSFAKGGKKPFRLDDDLPELVRDIMGVLAPGGKVLVCTNLEKIDFETFRGLVRDGLPAKRAKVVPAPFTDWDFELPGEALVMKAVLVERE